MKKILILFLFPVSLFSMQDSQSDPQYYFELLSKDETPENLLALENAIAKGMNVNHIYGITSPGSSHIHTLLTRAVEKKKPKFVEALLTIPQIDTTLRYQKIAKNIYRDHRVVIDLAPLQLAYYISLSQLNSSDDTIKEIIALLETHAEKISQQIDESDE